MRICIFGGTGPTGLLLVNDALLAGHNVVAFARSTTKLPRHQRLSIVEGHLEQADAIARAVGDSDAVLSLLGPNTNAADTAPLVTGYRNIVSAMQEQTPRRLVAIGTPSMPDDADGHDWKVHTMVSLIRRFQPVAYAAIVNIGQVVRQSELEWTLVRVPFLTNGPRTATVNVRSVGQRKGTLRLSRANAAAFILQQATDDTYLRQAPFISNT